MKDRKCTDCGNTFSPLRGNHNRCPACVQKGKYEKSWESRLFEKNFKKQSRYGKFIAGYLKGD